MARIGLSPKVNIGTPPPAMPNKPYMQDPSFLKKAQGYLTSNPSDMLNRFMPYYNQTLGLLGNAWSGANPGQAGLGMYQSGLLGDLYSRAQTNLANPNSSSMYANTMDRIAGNEAGAMRGMQARFGGRMGSGVQNAAQQALQGIYGRQMADAARTTAAEAERNAVADAQNISNMLGGFFESSKGRELQNAELGRQYASGLASAYPGLLGQLSSMMQWQAGNDQGVNQQNLNNLLGYSGQWNALQGANTEAGNSYADAMRAYSTKMGYYNDPAGNQWLPRQNQAGRTPSTPRRGGGLLGGGYHG